MREHWTLDPSITFLNHGSFGACPRVVLDEQNELRRRMEEEPVAFIGREMEKRIDEARNVLATTVGAQPEDLVFVPNATTGVNTILRSLDFAPGDQLLTIDHAYGACKNALAFVADKTGAEVRVASVPFPIRSEEEVIDSVLAAMNAKTKLLMIDHVTSPTGLVLPVERIVREASARGIDTLVDGAHAPGMLPLALDRLGAAYYTGNCHKWLCTPKGTALLHVRRDRQAKIRPLVISHGAASRRTDRSRFQLELDHTGTQDFTGFLSVPSAIRFLSALYPGGLEELRRENKKKVLAGRAHLLRVLGIDAPAPESMIGSLAAVPLPDEKPGREPKNAGFFYALGEELFVEDKIEVPVFPFPNKPKRILRIAAQAYNTDREYVRLAECLAKRLL